MYTFELPERLDTTNSGEVEKKLLSILNSEKPSELECSFKNTVYVSSAGLRIMLLLTKEMQKVGGKFILTGLSPEILSIFKMAGFHTILDIRDSIE